MSRASICAALCLVTLAGFYAGHPGAAADTLPGGKADSLPRYKLQVGQDISYSGHDEFRYEGGKFFTDSTWRFWVVKENDDGSWRIVMRYGNKFRQSRDAGGGSDHETVLFAWCDLTPGGQIKDNETLGYHVNPAPLLVRLPEGEKELREGWNREEAKISRKFRYRLLPDKSSRERVAIESIQVSPENVIYGFEFNDIVTFDVGRGLPEKLESVTKQTYGFKGEGKGTVQLDQVRMQTAEWCRGLWADAERYFSIAEKEPAGLSPEALEAKMQRTAANRRAAKEQIKSPEFLKQIDDEIKREEQYARQSLRSAKERYSIIDHPAAEWTCQDLSGKEHALKDCRGRVVVLDFWYRGCGWCVRAMPQVKEVAAHFADKPVTVFGMNTDREEADAQFVIDKLGLNYDNLKATGIPEKYKVHGFPTLIIIDQEGVVRDLHVGYSADLKAKVIESIERLLKKS